MSSSLSEAASFEFRSVLQRAAASGPYGRASGRCRNRADRLSFVAACVSRTILPRQIDFTVAGRQVLSVVARDGRLICLRAGAEAASEAGMMPCEAGNLAEICDLIDGALLTEEEIAFASAAFEASTDTRGVGVSADDLFGAAESSPLPQSPLDALEQLVAQFSHALLGVYYDQSSAEPTQVSEEVPEDVARWVAHRLAIAAVDEAVAFDGNLPLLVHPEGHCLALVGHIAAPVGLLFEPGSMEGLVEAWSRLLSEPSALGD